MTDQSSTGKPPVRITDAEKSRFAQDMRALIGPVIAELTDAKSGKALKLEKGIQTTVGTALQGLLAVKYDITAPFSGWKRIFGRRVVGTVFVSMIKRNDQIMPAHIAVYKPKSTHESVMLFPYDNWESPLGRKDAVLKSNSEIQEQLRLQVRTKNFRSELGLSPG